MIIDFKAQDIPDEHLKELILLSAKMHKESQFSSLDYEQSVFVEWVSRAIVSNDSFISGYTINGVLAGALLGRVEQTYFGKDKIANAINWYVKPEFRGTIAGIKLLKSFESFSISKGAKRLYIGTTTGINTKGFESIMNKLNYEVIGADYQRCF